MTIALADLATHHGADVPALDTIGEPVWDVDDTIPMQLGSAETAPPDPDRPIAVLWLPSAETRTHWRDYSIYPTPDEAERRPLGFRRTHRST